MPNPSRNDIYEAVIRRMVSDALQAQEDRFATEHADDTDEQLTQYLRQCAAQLKHTPWPREIVGGSVVQARFGSWEAALCAAKLPQPCTPDKISGFPRIQEETQRQRILYREKKQAKKERAQQRMKAQKEKRKQTV